jgi:hypothetical protein
MGDEIPHSSIDLPRKLLGWALLQLCELSDRGL